MVEIDWMPYYDLSLDEVEKRVFSFERQGWEYIPFDSLHFSSAKVQTPSGRILTRSDIEQGLQHLEIGNRSQIELLRAAEFFILAEMIY